MMYPLRRSAGPSGHLASLTKSGQSVPAAVLEPVGPGRGRGRAAGGVALEPRETKLGRRLAVNCHLNTLSDHLDTQRMPDGRNGSHKREPLLPFRQRRDQLAGALLWLVYGLLIGDLPVIVTNAVTLLLLLAVDVQIVRHRRAS